MTRWPSLRSALAALAGKHPVEQAKALMAHGVDWHLSEQSREADQARAGAVFAAIFAQKHADAINPALDAIRAVNERRATERREEYEDIIRGGVEISNRPRLSAAVCPDCGGDGFVTHMRPTCCGNVTGSGECRAHCAIVEEFREACEGCRGEGNIHEGIAEAREAARHHWNCKRNAA